MDELVGKSENFLVFDGQMSLGEVLRDRSIAVIVGGAIADSMGWITEFMRSPNSLERTTGMTWLNRFVSWPKRTGGRFNTYVDQINAGDYSDDTQLTLCAARSMEPDGNFNAGYFMKVELPLWLEYARGAGSTINGAAKAASRKSAEWYTNFFQYTQRGESIDYREAGANGAAMRVAPLSISNYRHPDTLQKEVWKSAIVTHGHPRAIVGALLMAEALRMVLSLEGLASLEFFPKLRRFISGIHLPKDEEFMVWKQAWDQGDWNFDTALSQTQQEAVEALQTAELSRSLPIEDVLRRLGCFERASKGSGIGTVAAALALFYRYGGKYKECVEHAVNLIGIDTDTIGAMAGQLAAALGGTEALPESWTVQVQDYYYLSRVGEALARIGARQSFAYELGPELKQYDTEFATSLQKASQLNKGQRVAHPTFGLGWVRAVHSQEIRRSNGGLTTLVDIEFDMGQSIRLRSHPGLLKIGKQQLSVAKAHSAVRGSE